MRPRCKPLANPGPIVAVRLPAQLVASLDELATQLGQTRSGLIRFAAGDFVRRNTL
jgi:predicted transcriptional regulator